MNLLAFITPTAVFAVPFADKKILFTKCTPTAWFVCINIAKCPCAYCFSSTEPNPSKRKLFWWLFFVSSPLYRSKLSRCLSFSRNHWVNIKQTCSKHIWRKEDLKLFKWNTTHFSNEKENSDKSFKLKDLFFLRI